MVEIEFKLELSDYKQLLSDWLKSKGKFIGNKIRQISLILFQYAKKQFHFLREFNYNKENITAHLMKKAAQFFGIELEEKQRKFKRRNKPFNYKYRLKRKKSGHNSGQKFVQEVSNWRKKSKKKPMNVYHAPE